MSRFLNLGLETEILVLSRARFVKKPVPGSELHGVRGCASLYRGMGVLRKPVPGLNPGSKSSPAYHNLLPWSLAITNLQQTPLLKLCAEIKVIRFYWWRCFQMCFYYFTCTAYNAYSVHLSGLKLRTVEHDSIGCTVKLAISQLLPFWFSSAFDIIQVSASVQEAQGFYKSDCKQWYCASMQLYCFSFISINQNCSRFIEGSTCSHIKACTNAITDWLQNIRW